MSQQERLRRARAVLAQVEARQDRQETSKTLREEGASRRVYHLDGSLESVALALATTMKPNQFAAVVGIKDLAWEGVEALGVDVGRIVVIHSVGNQGGKVIGSLLEGFSLVLVGKVQVAPRHQRALAARARALEATLITIQPWVGVSAPLILEASTVGDPLLERHREAS